MKRIFTLLLMALVIASLVACANKTQKEARQMLEKTQEEARIANSEQLLWSSGKERPEWILKEPETIDRGMAFIGLSARYSTEQQAREDARRNAVTSAAKFMSHMANEKFERARVSFGFDSSGIDATESSLIYQNHLAAGLVSCLKVSEWYEEKWQTPTGIAWKVYALSSVPLEAFDETFQGMAGNLAAQAERKASAASTRAAQQQAERAVKFWKRMEAQGLGEEKPPQHQE